MLSKSKIKYIQSLKIKKYRQMYGNFIVEGEKMALELLQDKKIEIEEILALETWILDNKNTLKPFFNKIITITETELKHISNLTTPNKVLVIAKRPVARLEDNVINHHFSLFLDGIQDPGNMGTIMRIADWFSIPYILCSETCVDIWNPKVIQASMGAFLRIHMIEMSFDSIKQRFPDLPIFVTILRGGNIFDKNFPNHGIIVIGNEGSGVSEDIIQLADFPITIPGGGGAESLNVGVATGIVCAVLVNNNLIGK